MKVEEFIKEYLSSLKIRKEESMGKINELRDDQKEDESNIEKIKLNVYDIFTTMVNVCEKKVVAIKGISEEEKYKKFCDEYIILLDRIPKSWKENLEKSKEKEKTKEYLIEETKLKVVNEIKELFFRMRIDI